MGRSPDSNPSNGAARTVWHDSTYVYSLPVSISTLLCTGCYSAASKFDIIGDSCSLVATARASTSSHHCEFLRFGAPSFHDEKVPDSVICTCSIATGVLGVHKPKPRNPQSEALAARLDALNTTPLLHTYLHIYT